MTTTYSSLRSRTKAEHNEIWWVPYTATCRVKDKGAHELRLYNDHVRQYGKNRQSQRFVQREWPDVFEAMRSCRRGAIVRHSLTRDVVKIEANHCRQVPYCAGCNNRWLVRRASKALDKLAVTTPPEQEVRSWGLVLRTSHREPTYDNDISKLLSREHRRFGEAAFRLAKRIWGDDIGAVGSYQEFGEGIFAKRGPHIQLVINHHALRDDKPVPLRPYPLNPVGLERLYDMASEELNRAFGKTYSREEWLAPRDIWITHPTNYRWVKHDVFYTMREMINFLKFQDERERGTISVGSYKNPHARTEVVRDQWLERYHDYAARIGRWGNRRPREADFAFGYLSDSQIGEAARLLGGQVRWSTDDDAFARPIWEDIDDGGYRLDPERVEL